MAQIDPNTAMAKLIWLQVKIQSSEHWGYIKVVASSPNRD
jgi:hypothetical protein